MQIRNQKADNGSLEIHRDTLLSYCGKYELAPGNIATVTVKDETLLVESPGLPPTPMKPISSNTFNVNAVNAIVTFIKDASRENYKIQGCD